ncbi:basic proline-rich protein-like [Budorcas taxicolor]|uniref:basic proline-rich protein-like n=1 Tax=Budorcas taxicolor TaxID=37181 RepID=UPI0022844B74|nr:basic proline-rich protein-like [Budorcas taxicolor]
MEGPGNLRLGGGGDAQGETVRARCRPTDVRSSGPTPQSRTEASPPAVFTFHQRRPRGFLPLQRRSAPPPEPRDPPLRRTPARPPPRPGLRSPAPPRAPAGPRVPPRAGSAAWAVQAPPRPQGPAPPARRPCHLAPPRAGPAPGGPERLGGPAPRRAVLRAVAGRGRALWLPLRGSEPAGAERRVAGGREGGPGAGSARWDF